MLKSAALRKWHLCGAISASSLVAAFGEVADTSQVSKSAADLENLTIEQLVNVQVTSVSKKETSLFTSPAAVYVITQEDIRRSGMTSIPELLRMVPGLDVAQVDANHWAISARGFNSQYANKLLVLIDGRTVYTLVSAGVDWNVQDVPLEDIDRIEVIRGPGATLWGANAVNGVINIITKSSKDTQGTMATVTYGTLDQPRTTVRYGGELATNLFYRGYITYFNRPDFQTSTGDAAADGWNAIRGGFRTDWEPNTENNFTLQGDIYRNNAGETIDQTTFTPPYSERTNYFDHDKGENVLGRWTRHFSDTSELDVQLYYDHSEQGNAPVFIKNDTYDFDLQYRFALGSRQDIVWGAGYRYLTEGIENSDSFAGLTPDSDKEQLFSTFLQDDITIIENRLHLIVGSKLEHNDLTGIEVEPSARIAWTPTENQTVWAAISRAVRTPAELERDVMEDREYTPPGGGFPGVLVTVKGNPTLRSEALTAYELGYRIKPTEKLSFDAAMFFNVYDDLITPIQQPFPGPPVPGAPLGTLNAPLMFENAQHAETYGTEISADWRVLEDLKLTASYTYLRESLNPQANLNNDPENQFQIHAYLDLPQHLQFDAGLYYVAQITPLLGESDTTIGSYLRLDVGMTWRPVKSLELGVFGQNLAQDNHAEFTSYKTTVVTEIPRSVMGRVTWRF